ncbi:MAG: deoxyribose-phosphate aldolase [Thermoleophilia bacterium]
MARRTGDIAKSIELMLLRPRATTSDCSALCATALEHHVAAVCVPPTHVAAAAAVLRGSDVKLVALISHPFGADLPEIKARACVRAIQDGAQEVEIATDLARFTGGDVNHVRDELRLCAHASREADTEVLVRGVIDTGVFDDRTLRLLARAVVAADIDMLVTSSGLSPEPNDVLDVELMREEVGAQIGVKAVRGVRSLDEVSALLVAGASRVGATSADLLLVDA